MSDLKVGDRVRITDNIAPGVDAQPGELGVLVDIRHSTHVVQLDRVRPTPSGLSPDGRRYLHASEIELASTEALDEIRAMALECAVASCERGAAAAGVVRRAQTFEHYLQTGR